MYQIMKYFKKTLICLLAAFMCITLTNVKIYADKPASTEPVSLTVTANNWEYGKYNNNIAYSGYTPHNGNEKFHYYIDGTEITNFNTLNAGSYEVYVKCIKNSNVLAIGSASFSVTPAKINVPTTTNPTSVYNGNPQKYTISTNDGYNITSNKETITNVSDGSITYTLSLKNSNYKWSDDTTTNKTITFSITPKSISVPTELNPTSEYNGNPQKYTISTNDGYNITSDKETITNVSDGSITYTLSLKNSNYKWSDDTTTDKTISFSLTKKQVNVPETLSVSSVYSGDPQTYQVTENAGYTITNNNATGITNVGETITYTLTLNDNYIWSDSTTNPINIVFGITKKSVSAPTELNPTSEYNGDEQDYDVPENDGYTISQDKTSATNAGETIVYTLTLKDNYAWADSSTGTKTITFTILKKGVDVPNADSATWNGNPLFDFRNCVGYTADSQTLTDVGEHTVTFTIDGNYKWNTGDDSATREVVYTINKADNTISFDIEGWTYGDNPNEPTNESSSSKEDITYIYSTNENFTDSITPSSTTNAGTYYVKGYIEASTNYNKGETVKSFTISKANHDISLSMGNYNEDDTTVEPQVTINDGTTPNVVYSYYNSLDDANGSKNPISKPNKQKNNGYYYVKAVIDEADNSNYNDWSSVVSFSVTKKTILTAPSNLVINSTTGDVTWTPVTQDYAQLQYSFDGNNYSDVDGTLNIADKLDDAGTSITVYLRYTSTNTAKAINSSPITCSKNVYTLTITPGEGIENTTTGGGKYMEGATATIGAELKLGYKDLDWNNESVSNNQIVIGTSNITLTPSATAKQYTIKYSGGECEGSMSDDVLNINNVIDNNTYTKEGYSFTGWKIDMVGDLIADGATLSSFITEESEDEINLVAVWVLNTYTFTFNPNGGSGTMENQSVDYSTTAKLNEAIFYKTGCHFLGWAKTQANADAGTVDIDDEALLSDFVSTYLNTEIELFAVWEVSSIYKVKLDVIYEGHDNTYTRNIRATYNADMPEVAEWPQDFTKNNIKYSFVGYFEMSESTPSTQYYDRTGKSLHKWDKSYDNVVLKGWYGYLHSVEYVLNCPSDEVDNSENPTSIVYDFQHNTNKDITLKNLTRTGYTFDGWYSDEELKTKVTVISKDANTDQKFYAKWTAIDYTITYETDNGVYEPSVTNPVEYTIEDDITIHNPTRSGFEFLGWTGTDLTTPSLNVTFSKKTGNRTYYENFKVLDAVLNSGYTPTIGKITPTCLENETNERIKTAYIYTISVPKKYAEGDEKYPLMVDVDGVALDRIVGSTSISDDNNYLVTHEEDATTLSIQIPVQYITGKVTISFKFTSTDDENKNDNDRKLSANITENTKPNEESLTNTLNSVIKNSINKETIVETIKDTVVLDDAEAKNVSENLKDEKFFSLIKEYLGEETDTNETLNEKLVDHNVIVDINIKVDVVDATVKETQGGQDLSSIKFSLTPLAYIYEDNVLKNSTPEPIKNSELKGGKYLIVMPVGNIVPVELVHESSGYATEYITAASDDEKLAGIDSLPLGKFIYDSDAKTVTFYISHFSTITISETETDKSEKSHDEPVYETVEYQVVNTSCEGINVNHIDMYFIIKDEDEDD